MSKITCNKCRVEKSRKEFQRNSKQYMSCNGCDFAAKNAIELAFEKAFKLFNEGEKK